MSITFTFARILPDPEFGDITWHGSMCDHSKACPDPEPCEDFAIYRCCDHTEAAVVACGCEAFDVNVSNTNAAMIFERLGLDWDPEDPSGSAEPADILARAMLGNVGRDDSGIAMSAEKVPGGPTVIDCGLRAGYFADRLDGIAELAAEAQRRNLLIGWA